jgi:hypothetical protein
VDIRLMTNTTEGQQQQQPAPSTGPAAQLTQPQGAQK